MNSLGTIKKYCITKETPLGYMISDGKHEYFLHRNETAYQTLNIGTEVDAFIYLDKKLRPAATLHRPLITLDAFAFVPVVSVLANTGVFVDIGISRDILVSSDYLPKESRYWPHPGDHLLCKLKVKADRLLARPLSKEEVLAAGKTDLLIGTVAAYVFAIHPKGILLVTESYQLIYVYTGAYRKYCRLGEKAEVKITGETEIGYRGAFAENGISKNKELILAYLRKHQGVMTITEKSSPDIIKRLFNISKKNFKETLGRLYKDKAIEILPDKIILTDKK